MISQKHSQTDQKYHLAFLNGAQVEFNLRYAYSSAYELWHREWLATFSETKGAEQLFSDNFTRQDEIAALFYGDICVAVCCHRRIDLSLRSFAEDSYFSEWPLDAVSELKRKYSGPMITAGQLVIHPDFRRTIGGSVISQVMVYLTLRRSIDLPISGVVVAARSRRGMNAMCEICNPIKITEAQMNGEPSALYVYPPHNIRFDQMKPEVVELGDGLIEGAQVSSFISPFFRNSKRGEENVHAA